MGPIERVLNKILAQGVIPGSPHETPKETPPMTLKQHAQASGLSPNRSRHGFVV